MGIDWRGDRGNLSLMGSRTRRRLTRRVVAILAGTAIGVVLFVLLMSTFIDTDVFDPKEPMAEVHLE